MTSAARMSVVFVCFIVFTVSSSAQGPCLTASKFGPQDQLGNLNHVDACKDAGGNTTGHKR